MTGVVMLAPHLREDNVEGLIREATHHSKARIEEIIAGLAPRPDLPAQLTRIPVNGQANEPLRVDPDPVTAQGDPVPDRVQARAPDRYGLQVTIRETTRDKLLRAQALLRHRNPSGDLDEVLDRALDALLAELEKEKFGKTSRPRAAKARAADADPRYVPNEVKRVVTERDGMRCAFVSDEGVRCNARGFLELDHRTMVCRGGTPTAEGLRWLCGPHNRYEAERLLGKDFVREKRARARRERAAGRGRVNVVQAPPNDAAGSARGDAVETLAMDAHPGAVVHADVVVDANIVAEAAAEPGQLQEAAGAAEADCTGAAHDASASNPMDGGALAESAGLGAQEVERDVTLAMRGMGFGASETRRAMADSARIEATTFEARLRAALAAWRASRSSRCSEGPFDEAGGQLAMLLAGKAAPAAAFDSR
ncbi:MAG: HNH endonuclease [Deltaproteobacteria bacterium]|nr:HNH endonuclease [Kofleriaceae bacterium]